jgi:hypothetical protein
VVRNQRDEVQTDFTVTNIAADLTLDCNQNDTNKTADNLGELIRALQKLGIVGGSTS